MGGTGGIGLACARRFLDEGARVVIAGLPSNMPDYLPEDLGPADRCQALEVDATEALLVQRLFDQTISWLGGRIDVLVHVAGLSGRLFGDGPLHECTEEGWERVMAANVRSVFLTNREAVRRMIGQPRDEANLRGSVINVGSVLSESPSPKFFGTVAYASSKGAVRSLTLAAAASYAEQGLRFNLVEPGLIDTPMAARAVENPHIRVYLGTKQPLQGGPGSARDVAEAILYVSEPSTRFVTGSVLPVDGGWRLADGQFPEGSDHG